jgi:hypothetical protein
MKREVLKDIKDFLTLLKDETAIKKWMTRNSRGVMVEYSGSDIEGEKNRKDVKAGQAKGFRSPDSLSIYFNLEGKTNVSVKGMRALSFYKGITSLLSLMTTLFPRIYRKEVTQTFHDSKYYKRSMRMKSAIDPKRRYLFMFGFVYVVLFRVIENSP